ncbi:tRNA-dihydrouridine(47) synthase [NAD(P)(+)] [Lindgomyces ingoldianus]|uniref:tRNA-dihydrouridine(47) synthase [NAD(P)(+)] n=1 Tax=Lindgomyces ingoldianus TaxID=673940 RepID=A0ACB6QYC9_9PLEO|nr:tRNA-dihydrouridine(47) synthase [NAD(P)(+)] [Lindgomyces ingoldianus]KAF2471097.1 tRNA-dihydrouridine(47) synthase [NAD(P)(+)] [Lindgomyces ingoldianus]
MTDKTAISADPAEPVQRQLHSNIENIEPDGGIGNEGNGTELSGPKRKINPEDDLTSRSKRQKGVAPIKAEYLIHPTGSRVAEARRGAEDDDAAEAADDRYRDRNSRDKRQGGKGHKKSQRNNQKGQNTSRKFGSSHDKLQLCNTRALSPEFSPKDCSYGDRCRLEHDLRKYLAKGKREDLTTFGGKCPIYESKGFCNLGWKCRFVGSHSEERENKDGRQELILMEDPERKSAAEQSPAAEDEVGVVNVVPKEAKINLSKRKTGTPRSDAYLQWVNANVDSLRNHFDNKLGAPIQEDDKKPEPEQEKHEKGDNRAQYTEPPFLPSEKRRIYYGSETPILAPLTTQGNLPFRRLCVELGAQVTWSEMAMGLPLIQGEKGEWALMKAHESEIRPPKFFQKNIIVQGYDNAKDLKFGAQIAANKPWLATKTVEVLTSLCPHLRAIDLNCGCPINLVCEQGAGSALLDNGAKLENILRGMNYVSNETPITAKIRMGTKDSQPTALKLVKRLVLGGYEAIEAGKGTSGVAAITLHGRSKQQRYTKSADWSYIAECAALIRRLKRDRSEQSDTMKEADPRDVANEGHVYFVGNGDCYSHIDYYNHLDNAQVDSVMVARGALIKPWIFEEIEKGQYLDKSASERLTYVEKFAKYGLQTWGSDEMGIGTTRRFLLEWLSFACRYVPVGLLEHLPPNIQDRAPAFKGRDDLESLMSSENYKDWIKISEMFLGPAHPDFKFEPKHKSNAYDIEAEG